MTAFNWRVLSPNTLRSYTLAARDFELVTGCRVQDADEVSIALFRRSMEGRRLSVGTIRQRLSAVAVLSGVKVELPQRQKAESQRTLNAEQVRKVMSVVNDPMDRMLLMKLLTIGTMGRTIKEESETFAVHFAGLRERTLNAQQASRKIRRYARMAGLNDKQVSMRMWVQSGRILIATLSAAELLDVFGHNPDPSRGVEWKPLHGIGRRSKSAII